MDHRVQEASVPLQAAMDQDVAIRKALQGRSAVAALVDDLNKEWTSLQAELRHFDVVPALDGTPMAGFSGQLTRLFERHNHERVTLPARYASAKLEAQLIQVRLTMAAGEGVHARELAGIAEIWLRRSARELLDGQRQSERLAVQAESLLSIDGMIRSGVDAPGFPPDQSSVTLERLDKAEALLDDHAGLAEFQSVAHSMQLLATLHEIVIDAALQVRMIEMIKLADAETPWAEVEAAVALASADPDHSSASKIRHLREILAVWDRLIQGIQVEEAKPALEAARRGVLAAVDAGDLPQVPPTYRALTTAWADYGVARAKDAADRAQKPDCERYVARIRNQLAVTGHALRWAEPGPASTKLDQELGRIEVALNGQPEAHRCMERLFQLDQDAGRLADAINGKAALEAIAPGSIVKATTATGAVPRALTLEITPQDETERTVGRRIGFMVRQMGDDWRQGVPLRLDFGDGSPPVTYTAEKWRQMGVEHTYALPGSVIAQIVTIGEFGAEGARPPMGQGEVTLAIGPAPDASARALADRFLSARFALALLIALVAYYWRFHARPIVFGARGYDYVEAFALGFAVNAAVAELPAAIAKFLPG